MLAAFNRRRRYNRFKYGHQSLELDRLKFVHTISKKDSDLHVTEVKDCRGGGKPKKKKTWGSETRYSTTCSFFQQKGGCFMRSCKYSHKCAVCHRFGHGAIDCYNRRYKDKTENRGSESKREGERRTDRETPPNPRFRRARADDP